MDVWWWGSPGYIVGLYGMKSGCQQRSVMSVAKWDFLDMELTLIHLTLIKVYFKTLNFEKILPSGHTTIYNHFKRKITYRWHVRRHTEKSRPPDRLVLTSSGTRVAHHSRIRIMGDDNRTILSLCDLSMTSLFMMPTVLSQRKQIPGRPGGTLTHSCFVP